MQQNYRLRKFSLLVIILIIILSSSSYSVLGYGQQSANRLEIYYDEVEQGKYKFYARNRNYAPYQLKLSFEKLENIELNVSQPYYTVVDKRRDKEYLFTAKAEQGKGHSFKYGYEYLLGNPKQVQPDNKVYLFPYQHGDKHKLTQGYNGSYSHQNTLALDFEMERGTAITAARSGVVVQMKENSNFGGPSKRYLDDANYITIYHQDGTFAEYAHLKYNGAQIRVGEQVEAGEIIGYSGNTGWSRGPHLHFEVYKPIRMGYQALKTDFLNYQGQRIEAEAGHYYYANHPGKGSFKVRLGSNLTNADYQEYNKRLAETNRLRITRKKVDDTVVLFIENGYERETRVKINFKSRENIEASKKIPYAKVVPPLTKVYAFLIKPVDPSQKWGYSLEYSYRR